jgi:hypothetical protein
VGSHLSHPVDGEEAYRLYTEDNLTYKQVAALFRVSLGGIRAEIGRVRRKHERASGFDPEYELSIRRQKRNAGS